MRTYKKILIFLFAATAGLATLIVLPSNETEEALREFRSLFSKQSVRSFPDTLSRMPLTLIKDETSLYYGGISLVAIILVVVALRMARGGELKAPRHEANEADVNIADSRTLLSRAERSERKATEAAIQDSEAKARKIYALEGELSDKEKLLKNLHAELETLRSQVRALTERQGEMMYGRLQEETVLREELERKTDLLKAKDSAIKELEHRFDGTIQSLGDQLREKDELIKSRGREVEQLRSELNIAAKRPTGSAPDEEPGEKLWSELSRLASAVQQRNDSSMETESSRGVQAMGAMLAEKEELLKTRDKRIEKLEAELKEKRTELARHEIAIRQSIERRDLWKRRLANFGITLKD